MPLPRLVFATRNPGKVKEIAALLEGHFEVIGLHDVGCHEEVPETSDTIEGNAVQKAEYVKAHYGVDCFADDTGLEVSVLGGSPGVHTAYYAGPEKNPEANMSKLLAALEGQSDRSAQFRTVIALTGPDGTRTFEGICRGTITTERTGGAGFGYDPVFSPDGHTTTFAEMAAETKNAISHRGIAVRAMVDALMNRG